MIRYFCDRCGREIEESTGCFTVTIQAPEIRSWADDGLYSRADYQICRSCITEIDGFIGAINTDCAWR